MIKKEDFLKYSLGDWYIEHAPARPLMLSGIVGGFVNGLKLKNYTLILCYYKKGELDWITLLKDQDELGKLIFKKHKEDKSFWLKEYNNWLKIKEELENNFRKLKDKNISSISNRELLKDINKYTEVQYKARKISSLADPFIFYTEKNLPKTFSSYLDKNPDFDIKEAIEIITKPDEPLFLNQVELDLIGIAKKVKAGQDIKSSLIQKEIKKHIDRFCWIKVESFFGTKEYSIKDVEEHLKELLSLDLDKEEKKNNLWQKNKEVRERYLSKHDFPEEILAIAELSPIFAKWQDLRKENSVMTTFLHSKYIKEISKRAGIEEDDIAYLGYSEIQNLLENKLDKSLFKKRKQGSLFVFKGKEFKVFYLKDIENFIDKIVNPEQKDIKEFSGTIACSGKVKGMVKIISKQEDISKMEKGNILVSTMTRPEHTLAMKKASAIITNEGGITCHAAVVSRELKIPCIIGTKIATKVLKDGDLVEVDADKGIVKILKK